MDRETFNIEKVRTLLKQLDATPGAKHNQSIDSVAEEYGVFRDKMLEFRDGNNNALDQSTVNIWAQLIGTASAPYISNYQSPDAWYAEAYGNSSERNAKFDQYDIMQHTRGEVDSAASVWADMVLTGAITEENRYSGGFLARVLDTDDKKGQALLSEITNYINNYILPSSALHPLVRDTCVYGSAYEQLGFGKWRGKNHIVKSIPMPIRNTRIIDPESTKAMYGFFTNDGDPKPAKTFESYRIAHFANRKSRADEEGCSVFKSSLRSWVQVEALEGGMITRRLERAPQRYKFIIDTSGCRDQEARDSAVEKYRTKYRKTRTVDQNRNFQQQKIAPPAGEDFYIGKSNKDSPADVAAIEGDAHLAEIADFDHFFNRLLAGLGPPKHHLGYEADTMRSVGTDLTIVFARKARRVQIQIARALNHYYWVELLLAGYDPRNLDYLIIPPTLGTRDELVRAQVMMAHATVCRYLSESFSMSGKVPSPQWFLRYVMGMDDGAIDAADMMPVVDTKKKGKETIKPSNKMSPSEVASMNEKLMQDDAVAAEIKWTKYIIQERMLAVAPAKVLVAENVMQMGDFIPEVDCDQFIKDRKIVIRK